jgi:hypothetical protein
MQIVIAKILINADVAKQLTDWNGAIIQKMTD